MRIPILAAVVVALFSSCTKKADTLDPVTATPETQQSETPPSENECYEFTNGKDSIQMTLAKIGNNVTGKLDYKWFEKDKNVGTFSGVFKGDTLFADYNFQSEGMNSVREIVFLKKENKILQGNGEMTEKGNRQVFVNSKTLKFDENMVLKKTYCDK